MDPSERGRISGGRLLEEEAGMEEEEVGVEVEEVEEVEMVAKTGAQWGSWANIQAVREENTGCTGTGE